MQSRGKNLKDIYEIVERIIHNPLHDDDFLDAKGRKYLPIIEILPHQILNAEAGMYETKNKKKMAIKVKIYQGAIDALEADELEALCAHELSHISNSDYEIQEYIYVGVGCVFLTASVITFFLNPFLGIPAFIISFVLASYAYKALFRTRERIADIQAAHIAGKKATISLLKKIASGRPYSLIERIFAMMELHPHWQDRIKLIEESFPDEERFSETHPEGGIS